MILELIKMGCNLSEEAKKDSDLESYRLRLSFIDKNGIKVIGDIMCNHMPVTIHTDFQYDAEDGCTYCYSANNRFGIKSSDYPYTKAGLLEFINKISLIQYNEISIME